MGRKEMMKILKSWIIFNSLGMYILTKIQPVCCTRLKVPELYHSH